MGTGGGPDSETLLARSAAESSGAQQLGLVLPARSLPETSLGGSLPTQRSAIWPRRLGYPGWSESPGIHLSSAESRARIFGSPRTLTSASSGRTSSYCWMARVSSRAGLAAPALEADSSRKPGPPSQPDRPDHGDLLASVVGFNPAGVEGARRESRYTTTRGATDGRRPPPGPAAPLMSKICPLGQPPRHVKRTSSAHPQSTSPHLQFEQSRLRPSPNFARCVKPQLDGVGSVSQMYLSTHRRNV
jgi:hypothetical protein